MNDYQSTISLSTDYNVLDNKLWKLFARGEPRTRAELVASSNTNQ